MAINFKEAKDLIKGIGQGASNVFSPYIKLLGEAGVQAGRFATNPLYRRAILNPESFSGADAAKLNKYGSGARFLKPQQIQNRASTAGTGIAATSKAMLGTAGLANPVSAGIAAGVSGGLTYGGQRLTGQPIDYRSIGQSIGYSPVYAGMGRLTARPTDVAINTLFPQGTNLISRALMKGTGYAGANILEESVFTPLTELRKPTRGELALAGGTGFLFGAGGEVTQEFIKRFAKLYKSKVNPKATKEEIEKAQREYIRDYAGRFAKQPGLGKDKPAPRWMSEMRKDLGLPENRFSAGLSIEAKGDVFEAQARKGTKPPLYDAENKLKRLVEAPGVGEKTPNPLKGTYRYQNIISDKIRLGASPDSPESLKSAMDAIRNGKKLPPITVKAEISNTGPMGKPEVLYEVIDGNHRLSAYNKMGIKDIPVLVKESSSGSKIVNSDDYFNVTQGGLEKLANRLVKVDKRLEVLRDKHGITDVSDKYIKALEERGVRPEVLDRYREAQKLVKESQDLMSQARKPNVAQGGLSATTSLGTARPKYKGQNLPKQQQLQAQQTQPKTNVSLNNNTPNIPGSELDPVQKITQLLKEAEPMREQTEELYSQARSQRIAQAIKVGEIGGEKGFEAQLGALKGELPKPQFSRIRQDLTQQDIDSLFDRVRQSSLRPYEQIRAQQGLAKLLQKEGGTVPQKSELKLLNDVFGKEFMEAIQQNRGKWDKILEGTTNALNIPRSIMASFDLSAPLRQGVFLIGRPKQWGPAFKDMFKAFKSEDGFNEIMKNIETRKTYDLMDDSGLALMDIGTDLSKREEAFMSNWAERIPGIGKGVRASGRAYTGFLNKLRADTFDDILKATNGKHAGDIAKFVNAATGRGDLKSLERSAVALNSVFFSPRLIASRLNLIDPRFYINLNPQVRKEALKSLGSFVGAGLTVLTLAKLAGAEVEDDPRNADFGKIKIGNQRLDIWGGFQQPIRGLSQVVTGKVISSQSGKEITLGEGYKPMTRLGIVSRFFESKTSPVASFVLSALRGTDAIGNDFRLSTEIVERFIPMLAQDMYDVAQDQESPFAALRAIPGVFGVGTPTYGKQELVTGQDEFGQSRAQIRPVPGLADTISNKLFGEQPLGGSASYNVETYYDQLLEMPREEAAKEFDKIIQTDPELAKKLIKVIKERQQGLTVKDKGLKAKGVSNGDRAKAVVKEFNKLETNEEKAALWDEYVKKGIITKDVARQMSALLSNSQ